MFKDCQTNPPRATLPDSRARGNQTMLHVPVLSVRTEQERTKTSKRDAGRLHTVSFPARTLHAHTHIKAHRCSVCDGAVRRTNRPLRDRRKAELKGKEGLGLKMPRNQV